jgi:hypothetical protein
MTKPQIRPKNNLLLLGSPYWSNYLVRLLNERREIRAHRLQELLIWLFKSNKSICLVGIGPPDTWKRWLYYLLADVLYFIRIIKFKAIYWIGTDVTRLKKGNKKVSRFYNFAGSSWLAKEIKDLGYKCDSCLFPVKIDLTEHYPWPETENLTVLCYIPDQAPELHGAEEILYLVKAFPNVRFNVVGGTGAWCKNIFHNLCFLGWCNDVGNKIGESHLLLRRTKHDSFSAFVREGLVADRYVIFTYELTGVIYVKSGDYEGLYREFKRLTELFMNGELKKNDNKEFIEMLDYESQIKQIEHIFIR